MYFSQPRKLGLNSRVCWYSIVDDLVCLDLRENAAFRRCRRLQILPNGVCASSMLGEQCPLGLQRLLLSFSTKKIAS